MDCLAPSQSVRRRRASGHAIKLLIAKKKALKLSMNS
jgi:hypothetical protein